MFNHNQFESILRCPITQKALRSLTSTEVNQFNQRIDNGQILQRDGKSWPKHADAVLQVVDEQLYYLVEDGIYILLPELALLGEGAHAYQHHTDSIKNSIQQFYDAIGWKAQNGVYQDAIDSEDLRTVSEKYITDCHLKINQHLPARGQYLLDIASGPVQYEPYLSYSRNFTYRICADISMTALKEAKSKLKAKGIYVLCDITKLPIQDNQMDGIVSLHTIYHVPKEQQLQAFSELNRVLKPKGKCVVVYSWGKHSVMMKLFLLPLKILSYLRRKLRGTRPGELYFHAYDYQWYVNEIKQRFSVELHSWRSVNVLFLKIFIHSFLGGKLLLSLLFNLEKTFPAMMGRIGAYPMFVFNKK